MRVGVGRPPARWHQRLGVRLALLLAGSVAVLLLVVGIAVNLLVTSGFREVRAEERASRLEFAAQAIVALYREQGTLELRPRIASEIARAVGGRVEVHDHAGRLVAQAGRGPGPFAESQRHEVALVDGSEEIGSLSAVVASGGGGEPFLRAFNFTLLLAGLLTVGAILGIASLVSSRMTRPLRDVAEAAGRLGSGDLAARAVGGGDRESRELAEAFNGMAGRLQRSEELRRRAASDIAHDLATPITVLESQLQAMVDGIVPADDAQLERARIAAAAVGRVVLELGELASAEAADARRVVERFAVSDVISTAAASLEPRYRERGVVLHLAPPAAEAMVLADRHQVERALRNVLANAAQHTPAGKNVWVGAEVRDRSIEVRVRDEGPGIAPEDLPHVFERFYRGDPARARHGEGTGIGLTIARELLRANDGRIEVESTGSQGTTFLLTLPAA